MGATRASTRNILRSMISEMTSSGQRPPHATATACLRTCRVMIVRVESRTSSSPIPSYGVTFAFESPLHAVEQRLCTPPTMCLLSTSCPSAPTIRSARRSKTGETPRKRRILYFVVPCIGSTTKRSTRSRSRIGMSSSQQRQPNCAPLSFLDTYSSRFPRISRG